MAKKYPIGIQTFLKIREEGFYYVDKTSMIYELAKNRICYFLSRPRRFGKSLLISTLEAYFEGRKELFEGLTIAELEKDWVKHPVLRLDFSGGNYTVDGGLEQKLAVYLSELEDRYEIDQQFRDMAPGIRFQNLIKTAHEKTGQKVVVLIDEYEKPVLEAYGNALLQEKHRALLRSMYEKLKQEDAHIRFALITGVTKIGKMSIFSALNNLKDISHDEKYSAICGISEDETLEHFSEDIEAVAIKNNITSDDVIARLKEKYDGYHFTPGGPGLYNPFSLFNAFEDKDFRSYWFATGTPDILVCKLKQNHWRLDDLNGVTATGSDLDNLDLDSENPIPLLYQTGYLTIKDYRRRFDKYILGFPNREVEEGFIQYLVPFYCKPRRHRDFDIEYFVEELESGQIDNFMKRIEVLLADCPYEIIRDKEVHFQNFLFILIKLVGYYVHAEYSIADGRIDMILECDKYLYIFEFKYNSTAEAALNQIKDKNYSLPFSLGRKKTFLVGVNFSHETRNVDGYIVEEG